MNRVYPAYYEDFRCIADRCEDTCCAGWEIDIDDATYEAYMKVDGEMGDRLRTSIRTYENEEEPCDSYEAHGFILTDDLRCPFLDERNLCDIYKALGEDALCEVCTNTPRNYLEYHVNTGEKGENDAELYSEISISASCPEAARLIYRSPEKMRFICRKAKPGEIAMTVSEEGVMNASRAEVGKGVMPTSSEEADKAEALMEEAELGAFLYRVRGEAIELLQDRTIDLSVRIRRFLRHAEVVQEAINTWESEGEELPETVSFTDGTGSDGEDSAGATSDGVPPDDVVGAGDRYRHFLIRMGTFSGLASIGDRWAKKMELLYESFVGEDTEEDSDTPEDINAKDTEPANNKFSALYNKVSDNLIKYLTEENRLYEYEHLLVYYAFLLLNRSIDDYDYLGKAKLVILSYLMNRDMDAGVFLQKGLLTKEDREENAAIYAREVEHAEENLADLAEEILFERAFDVDGLVAIV